MNIRRVAGEQQERLWTCLIAGLAYLPLLFTNMGQVAADTKQYLYLDPSRLLSRAPYMWDSHIGLGTVTHQNIGYLFPMGPYYWIMDQLGIPDWLAQRLWLGSIMFAAAMGVRYLAKTLGFNPQVGIVAGLVYMLSPYSLDYAARISVILLPWAGLGWLLGLTIRSAHLNRWREPILIALLVQVVGGVNATALIYAGVAPLLWLLIAATSGMVSYRTVSKTVVRIASASLLMSLWWIAGLSLQGGYGIDILRFTETIPTVAGASMSGEVLRGLGYWFFYGTDKVGPWIEASSTYTQNVWIIAIGYAIPAFAVTVAVFVRFHARRFLVLLMAVGMAIAIGTHPYLSPSPFGAVLKAFAKASSAGLALRSTGRAVPLVSLAIALLCGVGASALASRFREHPRPLIRTLGMRTGVIVGTVAVIGFAPIWNQEYYAKSLLRDESIPEYWNEAIADADAGNHQTRIMEIPGADFASYRWGGLVDPLTPGLTDRPYIARELIPWGSPASADVVNAVDRQFQEGVMEPEAIQPLFRLFSAGTVLARNDIQTDRFNLVRPAILQKLLADGGLEATQSYTTTGLPPLNYPLLDERALGSSSPDVSVDPVVRYELSDTPEILHVVAATAPVVMEGDGEGVVSTAAAGLLADDRILLQSGTLADDVPRLQTEVRRNGSVLVVTDSNRKRARRWSTVRENTGMTERADEQPNTDDPSDARLEVFPAAGTDAQSVALQYGGTVDASAYGNPISYTPEDRPVMAFDGDIRTAWTVGDFSDVTGEWINLQLPKAGVIDHLEVVQPLFGPRDRFITETTIQVGDTSIPIRLEEQSRTEAGQRIEFDNPVTTRELKIRVDETNIGKRADYGGLSGVGFAEIRVFLKGSSEPVTIRESIRVPTFLLDAVGEESASRALYFVLERARTDGYPPRGDEERSINRTLTLPTERAFNVGGVVRLNASSPVLSSLITPTSGEQFSATASSTLEGALKAQPLFVADGDSSTAWQPSFSDVTAPWLQFQRGTAEPLGTVTLTFRADDHHSVPTTVLASWEGGSTTIPVVPNKDGTAQATADLTAAGSVSSIRFTMQDMDEQQVREYYSNNMIAFPISVAEVTMTTQWVPLHRLAPIDNSCRSDLLTVDGTPVDLRMIGTSDELFTGGRASVESCSPVTLTPGKHELQTSLGVDIGFNIDHLVLASSETGTGAQLEPYGVVPLEPNKHSASATATELHAVEGSVDLPAANFDRWVILRQSVNPGWAASGASESRSLQVDGYANGWFIPAGEERRVTLEWEPQQRVWVAILLSGTAVLGAGLFLLMSRKKSKANQWVATAQQLQWSTPHNDPSTQTVMRTGILIAGFSLFVAGPMAGVVIAVLTGLLIWVPATRRLQRWFGGIAIIGTAGYIILQQLRYRYPAQFEWPTRFDRVHVLAWLGVLIPLLLVWTDPREEK